MSQQQEPFSLNTAGADLDSADRII